MELCAYSTQFEDGNVVHKASIVSNYLLENEEKQV